MTIASRERKETNRRAIFVFFAFTVRYPCLRMMPHLMHSRRLSRKASADLSKAWPAVSYLGQRDRRTETSSRSGSSRLSCEWIPAARLANPVTANTRNPCCKIRNS